MIVQDSDQHHLEEIRLDTHFTENEVDLINVTLIPHVGNHKLWRLGHKWGDDLMMENIMKHADSKYNINPSYDFNNNDFEDADIVHLCNLSHTALQRRRRFGGWRSRIKKLVKAPNRPLYIGGIRGNQGFEKSKNFLKFFDAIHVSNKRLLKEVAKYNPNVYLLYPGVDLERFRPMLELRPLHFTIGWAGDKDKLMKNFHLIPQLGYSYKVATKQNYVPHHKMMFFYNSLSTYVYLSSHEGCNRTILEAAACGLPIVSTDAGSVRELLDPEWIIESSSKNIVKKFREKIRILKEDMELRKKVGRRNRAKVRRWDWKVIVKELEEIWINLISDN